MAVKFPEKTFAIITILLINLCSFFYIVSNDTLFEVFLVLSIITVFAIVLRLIIKNGFESLNNLTLSSISDAIKLSKTYLRINRRFILVASIGLILAIGAISQTLFYGRSVQVQLVDEILDNPEYSYEPPMRIRMDFYVYWDDDFENDKSVLNYPFDLNDILEVQADVNQAILDTEETMIEDHIFTSQLSIKARSQDYYSNETYEPYLYDYMLVGIPQEQFSSLNLPIERGTLPNSTHPLLLIESTYPREYYDYYEDVEKEMKTEIENDMEIALFPYTYESNLSHANNLSISGITKLDTKDISDQVSQKLGGIFTVWSNRKVLLCSLENMVDICNYFNQFIDDQEKQPPFYSLEIITSIFLDTQKLDAFNVGKFTSKIKIIENKLTQSLIEYHHAYIQTNLKEQLDEASDQLFFVKSMFLIMSIPALGISLFLVIWSTSNGVDTIPL